jgi:hypothetical protein
MPHKPQNTQSLKKAFDFERNRDAPAYRERKKTSVYLWGRKTGADNIITDAYRENFDRIFGKKKKPTGCFGLPHIGKPGTNCLRCWNDIPDEPGDFDEPTEKGKR